MRTYNCKKSYFLADLFFILCLSFYSLPVFAQCPSADLNDDCIVDFNDLNLLAIQWLNDCNITNEWCAEADLNSDNIVDFTDFAAIASQWQSEGTVQPDITWGYINDTGVSGHEAFTGYMSKYETTNAQYCQFLNQALANNDIILATIGNGLYVKGASGTYSGYIYYKLDGPGYNYDGAVNGGATRINWTGSAFNVDSGFESHPVTYVSWFGATAFASYYGWRLPTEWQWQAVADYDGSFNYGCGITISNSIANYWNSTHPNGTTPVGNFGVYGYAMADMAGNIWEWTSTVHSVTYRVLRGGCWDSNTANCTVSYALKNDPSTMSYYAGFRVCY